MLELIAFRPSAGDAGGGLLYSDAGDGYGPHRLDRFGLARAPEGWDLSWTGEGGYPWPYEVTSLELRGFLAPRLYAGGTEIPVRGGRFVLPGPGPITIREEGSPA
jgi:alpha-glucosidase